MTSISKFKVSLLISAVLLFITSGASADQIIEIDRLVKSLNDQVKGSDARMRIIANVADDGKPDDWREFKSDEDRSRLDNGTNLNDNFSIVQNETGTWLDTMYQSPSRDWAQYVTYYFRLDGTLAKMETELRTFFGEMIAIRNRWFAPMGSELKIEREYNDLSTGKPAEPGDDFYDIKEPVYLRLDQLPVYKMIKN